MFKDEGKDFKKESENKFEELKQDNFKIASNYNYPVDLKQNEHLDEAF